MGLSFLRSPYWAENSLGAIHRCWRFKIIELEEFEPWWGLWKCMWLPVANGSFPEANGWGVHPRQYQQFYVTSCSGFWVLRIVRGAMCILHPFMPPSIITSRWLTMHMKRKLDDFLTKTFGLNFWRALFTIPNTWTNVKFEKWILVTCLIPTWLGNWKSIFKSAWHENCSCLC